MTDAVTRPQSATNPWVGAIGLGVLALVFPLFVLENVLPAAMSAVIVIAVLAFAMCWVDIFIFKAHRRESTGLDWSASHYNIPRIAIKLIGFGAVVAIVAGLYVVFPVYRTPFYTPFWDTVLFLSPYMVVGAIAYIIALDGVMRKPEDGYYTFGKIVLLRKDEANLSLLAPLARSWLIKAYFIPVMFIFLTNNMGYLPKRLAIDEWYLDREILFGVSLTVIYTIDLIFALVGYVFALRVIDTHERSSDPSMTAWIAALVCYPPFWNILQTNFINYNGTVEWDDILADNDILLIVWAIVILTLISIYTWATVAFGCRFSNMSHRGIITSGPYRFTKHPAYITKNLSWWMISLPFLAFDDPVEGLRHSLMLLMLNGVYFARAWTEERHLANDPVYRDYQAYIARHGLFRWFKILPADKIGRTPLNPNVEIK